MFNNKQLWCQIIHQIVIYNGNVTALRACETLSPKPVGTFLNL